MKSDIYWVTEALATAPRPRGGDWLQDEIEAWRAAGIDHAVSLLTPDEVDELGLAAEPMTARAAGIDFTSWPILDRGVPSSASTFWRFARQLAAEVARGRRVLVHCRQGIGRASMLVVGVLVAAADVSSEAIEAAWARVAEARGRSVPDTAEQRAWIARARTATKRPI